ncbi:MAG: hypothetical protein QM755_08990 [Luteolibacter sp.]
MARGPKDSSELDLWDFDGEDTPPAQPGATELPPATKSRTRSLTPEPRLPITGDAPARSKKPALPRGPAQPYEQRRKAADDLGELDDDLPSPIPPAPTSKREEPARPEPAPAPPAEPESPVAAVAEEEPEPVLSPAPADEPVVKAQSSVTPAPDAPAALDLQSIRTRLGLSKMEKIGLIALAVFLLAGGIYLLTAAGKRLPRHDSSADYPSYPVKGGLLTVKKATSFWREPIVGKDPVRRDTKLIPVVVLELEGSPSAVRAFFRNENGEIIGDPVTRAVNAGTVEIAATSGLDDIAFHASYRAGQIEPWKLELFEAPSTDSQRQDFKKLLETPLSNDRH